MPSARGTYLLNTFALTSLLWLGSVAAGFLGALTGLGGGVVLVPLLAIVFGVDIHYAIGASLVSVIATSSGAAAAYLKEGYSNMRIGMFLEIATTVGALAGAHLAALIAPRAIAIIFGLVLLVSAYLSVGHKEKEADSLVPDRLATLLKLNGTYPTKKGPCSYMVRAVP